LKVRRDRLEAFLASGIQKTDGRHRARRLPLIHSGTVRRSSDLVVTDARPEIGLAFCLLGHRQSRESLPGDEGKDMPAQQAIGVICPLLSR
jgi:hypothetical protein